MELDGMGQDCTCWNKTGLDEMGRMELSEMGQDVTVGIGCH